MARRIAHVARLEQRTEVGRASIALRHGIGVQQLLRGDGARQFKPAIHPLLGGAGIGRALPIGMANDQIAIGRLVDKNGTPRKIVGDKSAGRRADLDRADIVGEEGQVIAVAVPIGIGRAEAHRPHGRPGLGQRITVDRGIGIKVLILIVGLDLRHGAIARFAQRGARNSGPGRVIAANRDGGCAQIGTM
ncbi:hypothetical protein ACQW02_05335 [Humitalea sp. 24SJ18S-53]|uniref:hypothetical protein n=1 Tax=Humitalea sp. 24SJ18S-53 TaxID=3422307 RepID=UPI003D668712